MGADPGEEEGRRAPDQPRQDRPLISHGVVTEVGPRHRDPVLLAELKRAEPISPAADPVTRGTATSRARD